MHDSIINEIADWQMWQRIAGKEPKQIKLAKHHMRALREWAESTCIYPTSTLFTASNFRMPQRIYGMEIIEV